MSSLSIQSGEFFVLIPFTKKDKPRIENPSFSSSATSFADSAYSDMMQEFSSLRENLGNFSEDNSTNINSNNDYFKVRQKRGGDTDRDERNEGRPYEFLWNVLRSSDRDLFEENNCKKFVEVLQSVNCLSSPYSGKCMLLSEAKFRSSEEASCSCPVWLKKIMEAFAFTIILSGFLQLRRERMTSSCLKEVLERLQKFGVAVCMEDIECLSVLCPKVCYFL